VIQHPDVDAVWICSPSQYHADQIKVMGRVPEVVVVGEKGACRGSRRREGGWEKRVGVAGGV